MGYNAGFQQPQTKGKIMAREKGMGNLLRVDDAGGHQGQAVLPLDADEGQRPGGAFSPTLPRHVLPQRPTTAASHRPTIAKASVKKIPPTWSDLDWVISSCQQSDCFQRSGEGIVYSRLPQHPLSRRALRAYSLLRPLPGLAPLDRLLCGVEEHVVWRKYVFDVGE